MMNDAIWSQNLHGRVGWLKRAAVTLTTISNAVLVSRLKRLLVLVMFESFLAFIVKS